VAYCDCPKSICETCKRPVRKYRDSPAQTLKDAIKPIYSIIENTHQPVVNQAFHSLLKSTNSLMRTDRSYREKVPFSELFSILVEESCSDVDYLTSFIVLLKEGVSDSEKKKIMDNCLKDLKKHVIEWPPSPPVDKSERRATNEGFSIKFSSNIVGLGSFSSFPNHSIYNDVPQDIHVENPMDFN